MPGLIPHPSSSAGAVQSVDVDTERRGARLHLRYALRGDLARLRIAPLAPTRPGHDLWKHTCFEAFVGVVDTAPYNELNFSPSGEWAAFAFRAYRDGGPLADVGLAPGLTIQRDVDRLVLDVQVELDRLSPAYALAALRLGLSAVIEADDGALSYWALRHPPGKPDFHHADAFALRLEPSGGE
ncbi:MAG: DOMON-like domain-containing protein [bacterium]